MRKVVFIRHAKSSWEHTQLADYDRPVANRGLKDIQLMGKALKERLVVPDFVLSSGALRAYDTARDVCALTGFKGAISVSDRLYFDGTAAIQKLIQSTPEKVVTLFVFFHNPDINEIAIDLLGLDVNNVPTLGCVFTECEERYWHNWTYEKAVLNGFLRPKSFR